MLLQVGPGGTVALDRASRRDVVGRDAVAQQGQDACAFDVRNRLRLGRHPLEVGRQSHIGRVRLPRETVTLGHVQGVPTLIAGKHLAVARPEHVRMDRHSNRLGDLALGGPDVSQIHVLAVLVLAERLAHDVDVHRARQCVGHDQRRGGEVVHLHVRVDASLEVAIARQHRDDREIALGHGFGHLLRQGSRIADASGAAVADEVEAELLQGLS